MAIHLNKLQMTCLAIGVVFAIAGIGFAVWAATSDFMNGEDHVQPSESSIEKRYFTSEDSSDNQQETIRLVSNYSSRRPAASANSARNSDPADEEYVPIATRRSAPVTASSKTSFFDLPDQHFQPQAIEHRMGGGGDELSGTSTDAPIIEWERESQNVAKMLNTVSRIFGVDITQEEPYSSAIHNVISRDRSNWVTLSYLSLSVFLLKQMDRLVKLQPELLEPLVTAGRFSPDSPDVLNLLFVEPGINSSDLDGIIYPTDFENSIGVNDYGRLMLNVMRASEMHGGKGLDCIWTAYCHELNSRASLKGFPGTVARINGVALELMAGFLTPREALGKVLNTWTTWQDVDCPTLFPECSTDDSLDFLVELAVTKS